MKQISNPVVVLLELELAEARASLAYYKRFAEMSDESIRFDRDGLDLGLVDAKPVSNKITLPICAKITAAIESGMQVRVQARTFGPDGIGLAYAVDQQVFEVRDQAAVLGHLHENFVRELAEFLRERRAK